MTTICSLAVIAASLLLVQFISFSAAGVQVCDQPLDPGSCNGQVERYYYDKNTGTCKAFIYTKCRGNDNNFSTLDKCELMCKPAVRCSVSPTIGPCEAYMERYYYNQSTKTCKEFIYGGCLGNGNNFLNKAECERMCKSA